jgi:sulfur-oxidizing protein SoxY
MSITSNFARALSAVAILGLTAGVAGAGQAWDDIRPAVFGTQTVRDGKGIVTIKAPYRPEDMRAVPFSVDATLPQGEEIRSVTLVVDNNPSPVAATFKIGPGRNHVALGIKFRLNQQSDIRAIVETNTGKLYMASQLVKFAGGQAACSAPPATPEAESLANMGKMKLASVDGLKAATPIHPRVRLDVSHPNHTGMVLDQITLLYRPLQMLNTLKVTQGDDTVFEMDGSIALNENPTIEFNYRNNGNDKFTVVATDTDGLRFENALAIAPNS